MPPRPSTPSELAVIAFCASPLLMVLGLAGLAYGHWAPPDKHELAVSLTYYGGLSFAIGVFIAIAFWVVRRFTE